MESVLFRTVSGPINSSLLPVSLPLRHGSFSSYEKLDFSPLDVNTNRRIISRALSEPQPINRLRSISSGSQTFPEMLPEVDEESLPDEDIVGGIGSLEFAAKCFDGMSLFPDSGVGSASGPDRDRFGPGGSNSNNNSNSNKIGAHYKKMLKVDPNDPLLLRNYSKFLHEVEGDTVKAEEYYGRAILANPGDGELLSLYGKLIWDTQRDGERAKSYFDQAAIASPDDWYVIMVMGSYAKFMWEAEDDEEEETGSKVLVSGSQPLVAAF
ncbi:putative tetratricopeptide-like helical domain superfamily [Helianthus annuus]|nr:putative tetratricopeptide-like helical domain superfamily [Helianthus annuus]